MPDNSNINLIPSEVVKERSLKKNYKRGLVFSVIVFILSLIAAGVTFYLSSSTQTELSSLKNTIADKKSEIDALEEVERKGSILTARLKFIKNLLSNQVYYSRLMQEMDLRLIPGITVTNVTVNTDFTVNIAGSSSSTTVLQTYIDGLVGDPDSLFSNARILEVSIREGTGDASFRVAVDADSEKLIDVRE